MRRLSVFVAASAMAAVLSACSESNGGDPSAALVGPDLTPVRSAGWGAGPGPVVASSEPTAFMCTTSRRMVDGGYRYGRFYLDFPDGVAARAGVTTRFRYVLPTVSGGVYGTASCVIPGSRNSITLTARFFRLAPSQVVAKDRGGDYVLMCGSVEDPCPIAGVTGTAIMPVQDDGSGCDPSIHFGCEDKSQPGSTEPSDPWGDGYGEGEVEGDAAAFDEGPVAWAVCVLSVVGSTVSVMDVLGKFETWHKAWQDAEGAYRLWQVTVENNSDPLIQQLYEYQYKQALQRQEDAKGDVHSATNTSLVALGFGAVACGALALVPTP